ncbi:hypothetical protein RDWZM_002713 [Blomia tropicalis]|uniref:Winged helix-turn-helix domain-containing protein n=1 Tax=Blomia tropicalis TaxID=40697 RepID=A0A9Q0RQ59_BLOTA|nr:hypothetical protein RDWZM_002713 [Blomia tropicalis]
MEVKQSNGINHNGNGYHTSGKDDDATNADVIVMTTIKKKPENTKIRIERMINQTDTNTTDGSKHVAGGAHQGIVYLINSTTKLHQQELRELKFWFDSISATQPDILWGKPSDRLSLVQQYFREMVNPDDFPKNYIPFIMKLMKTLQQPIYRPIVQMELEVSALDEQFRPPSATDSLACSDDTNSGTHHIPLTEEKVLEMIEAAYPNPLSLADIANVTRSTEDDVFKLVVDLSGKGVARLTDGPAVVRVTSDETKVKRVRQMPEVVRSQQPTIAIITSNFCEKLAVDAMIENKITYVRYKVEGESNVYTLGNIGSHRVVATKLPAVGNSRSAMIAAGSTTTRLLGTFQHVEYVFLVGVGGGVPHYTDYEQHVRLGDVVVSSPPFDTTKRSYSKSNVDDTDNNNRNNKFGTLRSTGSIISSSGASEKEYVYVHCEKRQSSPDEPLNASNSIYQKIQTVDSFEYHRNRKECFMILRGIADYKDGTRKKEWQPYAALSAAAFMKAVLCRLDPMTSNDSI